LGWVKTSSESAQYGAIGLTVVLLAGVALRLMALPSFGRNSVAIATAREERTAGPFVGIGRIRE
jgi:hypothetical protein